MLRLARTLVDRGDVSVTVAVPDFIHRRMGQHLVAGVTLVSIPSGVVDDGGDEPPGPPAFLHAMEHNMPAQLEGMLTTERGIGARGVSCLVIDLLASWAIPVAACHGLPVVGFWPAMLATYRTVAVIPELMDKGVISESGAIVSTDRIDSDQNIGDLQILPAKLKLRFKDLPWLISSSAVSQKSRIAFWLQIVNRAKSIRSILVNSIHGEGSDSDLYGPPQGQEILSIGPLLFNDDPKKTTAMWQADQTCIAWLDKQSAGSVIYVSFGSWAAPIEPEKIRGFAHGLEASGRPFLWTLKNHPSWRAGLPDGYIEKVAGRGKIVSWAPQDDVLKHKAVGCYIMHCGWNSALEAARHGVRMICYFFFADHFITCAYMVNMFDFFFLLASSDQRSVRDCIERVMEGEEGRRLQQMVNKLRETITVGEAMSVAKRSLSLFMERIKKN
ncbi:UDP-glycosyltransferase 82A1 [Dichanthelium oligosanthes]|uniref:UDP-glycosyltransferase 82A1 n=1 Tax=Dichanthelium oligosanthes TaxID=888268 RepID=A0A1E5WDE6_9POAL|nr:UDP-glycosyltransferase 82A1 [Dichanthelium oligosanthes]